MKELCVESIIFGFIVVAIVVLLGLAAPNYFKAKLSSDAKEPYEKYVIEITSFLAASFGYLIYMYSGCNSKVRSMIS